MAVWKSPASKLNWDTRVLVAPHCEVVFMQGGEVCDALGPGQHALAHAEIPFLSRKISVPFGDTASFEVETYFVNREAVIKAPWNTTQAMILVDPVYQIPMPAHADGSFSFRITDGRKLFQGLAAASLGFTQAGITSLLERVVADKRNDYFVEEIYKKKIPMLELTSRYQALVGGCKKKLANDFAALGARLVDLTIDGMVLVENSPEVLSLRSAMGNVLGQSHGRKT